MSYTGLDKFIYPTFLVHDTDLEYVAGAVTVSFTIPKGVYWMTRGLPAGLKSLPDVFENALMDALTINGTPNLIEMSAATPLNCSLANSGIQLDSLDGIPFEIHRQSVSTYSKGMAMLGMSNETGTAYGKLESGSPSLLTTFGAWVPPVAASDKRKLLTREAFKGGPEGGMYTNGWVTQNRRKFLYRPVPDVATTSSPAKYPADPLATSFHGLPVGDTNNTFEGLWKSVSDGGDIFVIHGAGDAPDLTYLNHDYEVLRMMANDSFTSHLTDFGAGESYSIEFNGVITESSWGH